MLRACDAIGGCSQRTCLLPLAPQVPATPALLRRSLSGTSWDSLARLGSTAGASPLQLQRMDSNLSHCSAGTAPGGQDDCTGSGSDGGATAAATAADSLATTISMLSSPGGCGGSGGGSTFAGSTANGSANSLVGLAGSGSLGRTLSSGLGLPSGQGGLGLGMFDIQEDAVADMADLLAGADMGSSARRTLSCSGAMLLPPSTPSPQQLRR